MPEIPCHRLQGEGAAYQEVVAYALSCGFRVTVGELPGEINGICNHTQKTLTLRAGLEPARDTETLVHEIAHSQLHGPTFEGSRNHAELEAESVACIVCGVLGIDSGQYSWGYLAS